MITLITGKTGSGKSYKIISDILKILDTRKVITNLKMNIEHENYVYLDEEGLRKYIDYIASQFAKVTNLPELIEFMKSKDFFGAFFVIDECHLVGFRDKNNAIINWLSVHRHLNQDVYLVTQTLKKIYPSYYPDIHQHVTMIDSDKRVNKDLIGWYIYDEVGGDKIKTKYVKPNSQVFEIYQTGKEEKTSNVFVIKLLLLVSLLVAVLVGFYFLFYRGMGYVDENKKLKETNTTQDIKINKDTNLTENNNTVVNCNYYLTKPRDFTLAVREKKGWYICLVEKAL